MDAEIKKSLQVHAQEIVERKAAHFQQPLDQAALRFALDCSIESLHSNEPFLQWYARAQDADKLLQAMMDGRGEKYLQERLNDALAQVKTLRQQVASLRKSGTAAPAKPLPPFSPKEGM